MTFKIGDKVKLKEGLVIGEYYGDMDFTNGMDFYGIKTIKEIDDSSITIEGMQWMYDYTPEMLELVPTEPTKDTTEEMYLNMQYYMEYCQENGYVTPQDWIEKYKHFK